jgi:hypothetical protein
MESAETQIEEYILTRGMHLGHCKETFGKGAVIRFNPATRRLTIDGRMFEDYRDVQVLKNQAINNPNNPWIVQYSLEALREIRGESDTPVPAVPKRVPNNDGMEIVQSDEDSHETIDIRHTQVSKIKQAEQEAARQKKQSGEMPVVEGYQSVEDRIAELKDKPDTDLSARAERVRLMSGKKAAMPVVRDDSLGASTGSKSSAMNAGMPVSGRRADEVPKYVADSASARKQQVENNRQRVAEEMGIDPLQVGIDEITPDPLSKGTSEPVAETKEVVMNKVCPDCDEPVTEKAKFCPECGHKMVTEKHPETPPKKAKKMPVTE